MERVKRPKVLLLGNGILQAFEGESWSAFLESIKMRNDISGDLSKINCPEPLKAILVTNDQVDDAMKGKRKKIFEQGNISVELATVLQELLSMDFDYVLTTNYTYELEQATIYPEKLTKYKLDKMATSTTGVIDRKYLLHTYNRVDLNGKEIKIWHIHGEAKKPSSTILGHYYYGNTLFEIKKTVDDIRRIDYDETAEVKTWVESFLFSDIYCLGFGFGLAEFDLWWLLNRKAREKRNSGKLYFYEPMDDSQWEKVNLLQLFKMPSGEKLVEIVHLNCTKDNNMDWKQFYAKAIADIQKR